MLLSFVIVSILSIVNGRPSSDFDKNMMLKKINKSFLNFGDLEVNLFFRKKGESLETTDDDSLNSIPKSLLGINCDLSQESSNSDDKLCRFLKSLNLHTGNSEESINCVTKECAGSESMENEKAEKKGKALKIIPSSYFLLPMLPDAIRNNVFHLPVDVELGIPVTSTQKPYDIIEFQYSMPTKPAHPVFRRKVTTKIPTNAKSSYSQGIRNNAQKRNKRQTRQPGGNRAYRYKY